MASLYELTQQALLVQEMLLSGDIDEDTFRDTVDSLDINTKVENICKVIRNLEADAKMFKEEKDRLAARQKAAENGAKRLKELLLYHLNSTNKTKVDAGVFKVSKRSVQSVVITDTGSIPLDFLEEQLPKINKAEILKELKEGHRVEGAELSESEYVTIR